MFGQLINDTQFARTKIGIEHRKKLSGISIFGERMITFLFSSDKIPPIIYRQRDHFLQNQKQIPIFIFMLNERQPIYCYEQDDLCEALRFGFNGQEKVDEISGAGNHNTALFWEYDTRLGRRWNLDPKPIESVSSYAVFANNPILMNDPLGDTTYIYNTKGIYVGVILDKLSSNEIVFMSDKTAQGVMRFDRSGKVTHEQAAGVARSPNFAYARLTENTRKQLYEMRQIRGNSERMGLLWIDPKTKELQTWECKDCGKNIL